MLSASFRWWRPRKVWQSQFFAAKFSGRFSISVSFIASKWKYFVYTHIKPSFLWLWSNLTCAYFSDGLKPLARLHSRCFSCQKNGCFNRSPQGMALDAGWSLRRIMYDLLACELWPQVLTAPGMSQEVSKCLVSGFITYKWDIFGVITNLQTSWDILVDIQKIGRRKIAKLVETQWGWWKYLL